MKKKKHKKNKNLILEIFCLCVVLYSLISAGRNYYKLSNAEKNGIIETVIIDSISVETHSNRTGIKYNVKIEYILPGENSKQVCNFHFKPSVEYYENQKIQIIRDLKNDFKIPVNETKSYKRCEILGNILRAVFFIFVILIPRFLQYLHERNKRIKKLAKKNPELKEKYKKKEKIKIIIFLIIYSPILFVEFLIEWIKNHFNSEKRK